MPDPHTNKMMNNKFPLGTHHPDPHVQQIVTLQNIVAHQQEQIDHLTTIANSQTESIRSLFNLMKDQDVFEKHFHQMVDDLRTEIHQLKQKEKKESSFWKKLFPEIK